MSGLARALSFMPKADVSMEVEVYINFMNFPLALCCDKVLSLFFLLLTKHSLSLVLVLRRPESSLRF